MLQQVMTAPGVIQFREVPTPQPQPGEVLVKIMKIGVCGSDIHVYHGEHPFTKYPITQGMRSPARLRPGRGGHRVHLGPEGDHSAPGGVRQVLALPPRQVQLCEELKVMGFQTTGVASHYFAVDAKKVTPLPEGMSFDEGAMIEPLAVAVHAVRQAGGRGGQGYLRCWGGPHRHFGGPSGQGLGARKVMVTDVSDIRLEKARECGADVCVNTRKEDFAQAFVQCFGPDKADVIYDCAGNNVTMGQAIANARKGSTIILVAVFATRGNIDLAVLNDHELDLNTSMMYRNEDYLAAIELVNQGKVQLKPLISKHFAFQDYLKAYQYIDENRETTMKVIINVQE